MSILNDFKEIDAKKLLEGIKDLSLNDAIVSAVLNLVELEVKTSYLEIHNALPTERYVEDIIVKNELNRISLITISILSTKVKELNAQYGELLFRMKGLEL